MMQNHETPAEVHEDYRHWSREISLWKDEIEIWKKELANALKDMDLITELIRGQNLSLDSHIEAIKKIESSLEFHEKNLARSVQDGHAAGIDDALLERHSKEVLQFVTHRETHQRIKRHQHHSMARIAELKTALESAI